MFFLCQVLDPRPVASSIREGIQVSQPPKRNKIIRCCPRKTRIHTVGNSLNASITKFKLYALGKYKRHLHIKIYFAVYAYSINSKTKIVKNNNVIFINIRYFILDHFFKFKIEMILIDNKHQRKNELFL